MLQRELGGAADREFLDLITRDAVVETGDGLLHEPVVVDRSETVGRMLEGGTKSRGLQGLELTTSVQDSRRLG